MSVVRAVVFLLMAALCAALGQTELHDHDDLLAKAFREGPGEEEISDPFQVLRHNPELKAELTQAIRKVDEKYKFRIRVLIRPVWMGGTVQELAGTLQDVWFPKGNGLVMIIETDNRKLGLGVSMHGDPEEEAWLMPTHASATLLKRVADRVNRDLPLEEYLRNVVLDMVAEHEAFLEKRTAPTPVSRTMRDVLFMTGAFSLVALGALVVAVWGRISRAREGRSAYRFPAVSIPERLGAPFGGGTIATKKFDSRV